MRLYIYIYIYGVGMCEWMYIHTSMAQSLAAFLSIFAFSKAKPMDFLPFMREQKSILILAIEKENTMQKQRIWEWDREREQM